MNMCIPFIIAALVSDNKQLVNEKDTNRIIQFIKDMPAEKMKEKIIKILES